jgi:osmotically inducible protein OsmC
MALSGQLGERGITAESIEAKADVTLDFIDGVPTVSKSHLTLKLSVPGADAAAAEEAIHAAKAGCPISRLLNAEVTLDFEIA